MVSTLSGLITVEAMPRFTPAGANHSAAESSLYSYIAGIIVEVQVA